MASVANSVASPADFLQDIEVVMDVFERAVIGQMIEQVLYLLLGGVHDACLTGEVGRW